MQRRLGYAMVLMGTLMACGPGRQATWEKEPQAAPKAPQQPSADEGASPDEAAAAEAAWQARDQRASLEKAIALWEKLTAEHPDDAALWVHLARGYYLLADAYMRLAGEDDAMLATFEKGVQAGEHAMLASSPEFAQKVKAGEKVEEAVKLIPKDGQAAIYWYATNLGKFAVTKGFTTTLFYKDRIFAVMQQVLKLDENFFYGAPHRYFGAFYAKAPSFAGGDLDKSKEHFEKGLAIEPHYLGTKVLMAEYYATKRGDREMFTKLLNEVLAADPTQLPDITAEQKLEQEKAKQMLARTDELF